MGHNQELIFLKLILVNVGSQIAFTGDADGDGSCDLLIPFTVIYTIYRAGDNHFGYVGFRYSFSDLLGGALNDDGAVDVVVRCPFIHFSHFSLHFLS